MNTEPNVSGGTGRQSYRRPLSGSAQWSEQAANLLHWHDANGPNRVEAFRRVVCERVAKMRLAMARRCPAALIRFDEELDAARQVAPEPRGDLRGALLRAVDEDAEGDVARSYLLADVDHSAAELKAFIRETTERTGADLIAVAEAKAKLEALTE